MLCSIKYAQAFSLEPATTCHVIGYELDPNDNKQAEDRLIPQYGTEPINAYYYCCSDTDDVYLADLVNQKNKRITLTLGSHTKTERKDS